MSSAYITRTYVETFLSTAQVNSLLSYGENTNGTAKLDLIISASSDTIDSFLNVAGYTTPLSSVPASIQKACFYLTVNDLYASCQQPIPDSFSEQISQQYAYLNLLKDKHLQLEGLTQDTKTGTGGSVIYDSGATTVTNADGTTTNTSRVLSIESLKGSFF